MRHEKTRLFVAAQAAFILVLVFVVFVTRFPWIFDGLQDNLVRMKMVEILETEAGLAPIEEFETRQNFALVVGRLYMRAGDVERAIEWLWRATDEIQADLAYHDLCHIYWENDQITEAIETCLAGNVPAKAWMNRAALAVNKGDIDQAVGAYRMAHALDPQSIHIRYRLASQLQKQSSYAEIVYLLEPLLGWEEMLPVGVYSALGGAYSALVLNEEAERVLLEGNRHYPESTVIWLYLGNFYFDAGRWRESAIWYDRYLQENPSKLRIIDRRARAARSLGDWETAQELYEYGLELAPENLVWWLGLGESLTALGKKSEAEMAYRQAQILDPTDSRAGDRLTALQE